MFLKFLFIFNDSNFLFEIFFRLKLAFLGKKDNLMIKNINLKHFKILA